MAANYKRTKEYKAETPYRTINKIRNILCDLDIFVEENHSNHSTTGTASCRVIIADGKITKLNIGTNGKGMNARYSLASGYAEFMERLQNSFLLPMDMAQAAYRKGDAAYCYAPDEKMMSVEEIFEECGEYLGDMFQTTQEKAFKTVRAMFGDDKTSCVPFKDAVTGKTIYFPFRVVSKTQGSNGMCAGNTEDEALVQGFSELMERYALAKVLVDELDVKRVHPEDFKGTDIYNRLEALKEKDFEYEILDFSLGKGLPVIGLKIKIKDSGVMSIWVGSDPCPETALERCLTEMFQGLPSSIRKKFTNLSVEDLNDDQDRYINAYNDLISSSAFVWPEKIRKMDREYCETFPYSGLATEKADNEYMQKLSLSLGKHIFIRDAGYLGFPSYWVVVPGISPFNLEPEKLLEELKDWHDGNEEMIAAAMKKPEYDDIVKILNSMYSYKRK